jgi:hypothetical protein
MTSVRPDNLQDAIEFLIRRFGAIKGDALQTQATTDQIGQDEAAQIIAGIDMLDMMASCEALPLCGERSKRGAQIAQSVATSAPLHPENDPRQGQANRRTLAPTSAADLVQRRIDAHQERHTDSSQRARRVLGNQGGKQAIRPAA